MAVGFTCSMNVGGSNHVVGKAQDVDLSIQGKEIETTTRGSGGWKEFVQGLKEADISIEELWLATDAAYGDMQSAFLNGTVLAFVMIDLVSTGKGFSGNMIITGLGMKQPLNGAVTCPIKAKITGALATI